MKISTKALQLIEGIDWKQLKAQKKALLAVEDSVETGYEDMKAGVDGVIALIDSLQDFAVDVLGKDENEVFHFPPEDEEPEPCSKCGHHHAEGDTCV